MNSKKLPIRTDSKSSRDTRLCNLEDCAPGSTRSEVFTALKKVIKPIIAKARKHDEIPTSPS